MERFVRLALFLIAVIVVIVGIFVIVGAVTPDATPSEPSTSEEEPEETQSAAPLQVNTSTSKLDVRGPIVGREDSYRMEITISADTRKLVVFKGDESSPVISELRKNDDRAYSEFLGALAHNGVNDGVKSDLEGRGYCYKGELYELTYSEPSRQISKWDSDCDNKGDLDNDRSIVRLFKRQFPESVQEEVEELGLTR